MPPLPLEKTFGAGGDARRIEPRAPVGVGAPHPGPHFTFHIPCTPTPPAARRLLGTTVRSLPAARSRPAAEKLTVCRPLTAGSTAPSAPAAAAGTGARGPQGGLMEGKEKTSHLSGCSLVSSVAGGGDVVGAESAEVESKAFAGSHIAAGLGLALLFREPWMPSGTKSGAAKLRGRGAAAEHRAPAGTREPGADAPLGARAPYWRRTASRIAEWPWGLTRVSWARGRRGSRVPKAKQAGGCGSSQEAGRAAVSTPALCRLSPEPER